MKSPLLVVLVSTSFVVAAAGQAVNGDGELRIIEKGPHHRVVERMVRQMQSDGSVRERKSSYTELATGMHYRNEQGEWIESKEEIEIVQGVAVARQGIIQVIFAANLNSPGAIDLLAPGGQRFRSHVLGLVYTDYASGQSVMIAEVKDSIGAVQAPNKVIYQDAFDGDCIADVRFTYTKNGFEQDIILRTAPPSPAEWGLNPETTRLEVFTEFIEAPEAQVTPVVLRREENPIARQQMVEPDLIDQRLDFGGITIGQGLAFPLDAEVDAFRDSGVPTGKSLERIDGRLILIEKVDYPSVREQLELLPKSASINKDRKVGLPEPGSTMMASLLPARPTASSGRWQEGQYARVDPARKGFVLDYIALTTSTLTNYVFKGDTTYYVSGDVKLAGTTTLEGGAVIKYTNSIISARLWIQGPLECLTTSHRPAFFTARDDGTIGEPLPGAASLPNTNAYYGNRVLDFVDNTNAIHVQNIRIRYGYNCLASLRANVTLSHAQISQSYAAFYLSPVTLKLRNVLVHDVVVGFLSASTNSGEHVTFHRVGNFNNSSSVRQVFLTNSLLISASNATYSGVNTVSNLSDSAFFQTVGPATHYLAGGSTNRDAGTTNLNATLVADLKRLTTYPPIVLTNHITNDTVLTAQAQRDTDLPDLGYHHAPLDFITSQLAVTNATLTLQAGTALGVYGSSSAPGLLLLDGGKLISEGTPDNLNRIVRYDLVQEFANTNWSATSVGKSISTPGTYSTNNYTGEVRLRFTEFAMPANGNDHLYTGATNLTYSVKDSQFHGGQFTSLRPDVTLLNNLFNRVVFKLYSPENGFSALVRNGTYFGGTVTLSNVAVGGWNFQDNLFDTTNLVQAGFVTNNYNGYLTNSVRLTNNGANDVLLTVTNIIYDTGWLGRFYLPTNLTSHSTLFNAGSLNATNAGLYHYTMVTNQTRELTTTVDIGFHYVAVNGSGLPLDTDGDGLADYFEDTNGNGSADSGETDWQTANDWGLRVFMEPLI